MQQYLGTIGYLVIFFAIMYMLMIRPQKKQQQQRKEMLSRVKTNDHVVTIGGMHGKVTRVKEDRITLKIADKVEVDLEKSAIASIASASKEKDTEKVKEKTEEKEEEKE